MIRQRRIGWLGWALLGMVATALPAIAGQVEIVHTQFILRAGTWQVFTTFKHGDTGWEHYADAWRVVTETGDVLATRTLFHPHVEEQPFTRSQGGIAIAKDTHIVFVEAHDKEHGWSPQRVRGRSTSRQRRSIHRTTQGLIDDGYSHWQPH